jgi:hypothetical protein
MMRTAISSPPILDRFNGFNRGKPFADRVKPFSFLLAASVRPTDRPPQSGASKGFRLVAPYSRNPADWVRSWWTDAHTGKRYPIRTGHPSSRSGIRVQTHADVLDRFRDHPEAKSADSKGNHPSNSQTIGLLSRLPVRVLTIRHIGKETNLLEQQTEGVALEDPQTVYTAASDWEMIRSWLKRVSLAELAKLSGVHERRLRDYREGKQEPRRERMAASVEALARVLSE